MTDKPQKKLLLVGRGLSREIVGFLEKRFEVVNPAIPEPTDDEEGGIAILTNELKTSCPDVVVAGSRGAKLAVKMMHDKVYTLPTLIISGMMPSGIGTFPITVPVLLVHGINDITIPIQAVRTCASTGWVKLVEVDDNHSMRSIIDNGDLENFIYDVISLSTLPPPKETQAIPPKAAMLAAIKARK